MARHAVEQPVHQQAAEEELPARPPSSSEVKRQLCLLELSHWTHLLFPRRPQYGLCSAGAHWMPGGGGC